MNPIVQGATPRRRIAAMHGLARAEPPSAEAPPAANSPRADAAETKKTDVNVEEPPRNYVNGWLYLAGGYGSTADGQSMITLGQALGVQLLHAPEPAVPVGGDQPKA